MGLEVTFVGNVFGALKHYTKWSKVGFYMDITYNPTTDRVDCRYG